MKKFDLVLYHFPCYDGFTSYWVAKKALPDAEFVPASYKSDSDLPDFKGRNVLLLDFTFRRAVLADIAKECESLTILDHHEFAQEDLDGVDEEFPNVTVYFDMDRSGAGMTWDYFHPNEPRPRLVDHVEDRDIWKFKFPETKAFHAGLARLEMTEENWNYADKNVDEIVEKGTPIVDFIANTVKSMSRRAEKKLIPPAEGEEQGQEVLIANVPIEFGSETGNYLLQTYPQVCVICWSGSDKGFYCSTRSVDEGPSAMDLAAARGGGGHRNAAGFTTSECPTTWETLERFSFEKDEEQHG